MAFQALILLVQENGSIKKVLCRGMVESSGLEWAREKIGIKKKAREEVDF